MALQYTTKKSQMTQGSTLFTWQELFRWRLTKSAIFRHAKIPENLWFFLFSRWKMTLSRTMGVESRRQLLWQHDNDLECVEGGAGQWQAPHTAPTIHHLQCHAALWATRKQLEGKIRDRLRWWQYLWLWATFPLKNDPALLCDARPSPGNYYYGSMRIIWNDWKGKWETACTDIYIYFKVYVNIIF